MSEAKSQVQVSITAQLNSQFSQAFQSADKRMQALGKTASDLNRKIGDVQAYRRQQNALKDSATQFTQAKAKVAALRKEIAASESPTRKQAAALAAAERQASRAGAAYQQARTKLADMGRELQRNGVNVNNLSKEYKGLQNQVTKTNAAQTKAEASLKRQQAIVRGMATAWNGISKAAIGVTAAGAVLAQPTKKALTYEEQLAYATDTAGAGKSVQDKQALQKQLSDAVDKARRYSGGASREDVMSSLSTLIASGKFSDAEAMSMLPVVARTAFAGNANPEDIAKTAIAMKSFGIQNLGAEFDKMFKAGQMGNFELKDMARYLPSQLAMAKASGYSGSQGITDLLAMNQVAMRTAGTQDEAGNNVVNLLQKFSSREFSDAIAKNISVRYGDPVNRDKKGRRSFDWSGYLMSQREKGVGAIDAFAMLLDRQMAGNKDYQKLQKRIAGASSNEERQQMLGSMANIAEGSQLGQIIADRQALMAALASIYGREQAAQLKTGMAGAGGAINQSHAFLSPQNFAQAKILGGNVDRANEQAYNSISGPLNTVIEGLNEAATEFPKLTTAAYGAAAALSAVAAAGLGMGAFDLIKRRGAGAAAGAAAGGAAAAGAGGASVLGIAGRLAGPAALAVGVSTMTTPEEDKIIASSIDRERALYAQLQAKYGDETLNAAYQAKAPWYQFGGPSMAQPDKLKGWVEEYVGEHSTAAADSAKAASEAAKAAQSRPNITHNPTYSFTYQGGGGAADEAAARAQFDRMMKEADAKRNADMRSLMTDRLGD